MNIIEQFEPYLMKYCSENSLSYDKVKASPRCGNNEMLFIQHIDSKKAEKGLTEQSPAEILLSMKKNNDGTFTIEQGKNAMKYLSN